MNPNSLYREFDTPVIVRHHRKEDTFIAVPHLHSQYEIYYHIHGGQSFFVDNTFYTCEPHSVFLIPNTQIHKVTTDKNIPYERCIINLHPEIVEKLSSLPNLQGSRLSFLREAGQDGRTHKIGLSDAQHIEFLHKIDTYITRESTAGDLEKLILLLEILRFLEDNYRPADDTPTTAQPLVFSDQVIAFIEQNPAGVESLDPIAAGLYVSKNTLCTKFKAETGLTVNHYLILRKIAEAKKLLYQHHSVKEACFRAGFQSYSAFVRAFKEYEGILPGSLNRLSPPL